jgi:hypothetical protein
MASPVSYTQAAKGVVFAVAAGLYFHQGRTVSAVALGVLGNCALGLGKKIYNSFSYFHEFGNRRAPTRNIQNPVKAQDALNKALERLQKDYPEEFNRFVQSEELSSKEEIVEFFTEELSEGCCAGTANALFDKIVRKQSRSLEESYLLLQSEDVFYHQILQIMRAYEKREKDFTLQQVIEIMDKRYPTLDSEGSIAYTYRIKNLEKRLERMVSATAHLPVDPLENVKKEFKNLDTKNTVCLSTDQSSKKWRRKAGKIKMRIEKQYDRRLKNLHKNHHFSTFLESENFLVKAPYATYRANLEKAMLHFPGSHDFVGVIRSPQHVISFQYGPKGYFIYDAISNNKGLFSYPTSEKFFQGLRHHALWDTEHTKYSILEKEKQGIEPDELRDDAQELVKKFPTRLSIRPLDDINPSLMRKNKAKSLAVPF